MPTRRSSDLPKSNANKLSGSRRTPVAQSKSLPVEQPSLSLPVPQPSLVGQASACQSERSSDSASSASPRQIDAFPRKYCRRHNQRGFALLLVFLMAAVVAITLYMELPRVAMEAQRDKEQTLIDRGEWDRKSTRLFVNKAKRYPGDIKELENFQNQRFLRHRYVDPMTGKDEWRQIHIANGVLTDSMLTKPTGPGGKEDPKTPNGFVGELAGLGGSQNSTQGVGASSVRDRRRTSDGANATMPGPALPGGDLSGGQNSGVPPLPGQGPGNGQSALPGT